MAGSWELSLSAPNFRLRRNTEEMLREKLKKRLNADHWLAPTIKLGILIQE